MCGPPMMISSVVNMLDSLGCTAGEHPLRQLRIVASGLQILKIGTVRPRFFCVRGYAGDGGCPVASNRKTSFFCLALHTAFRIFVEIQPKIREIMNIPTIFWVVPAASVVALAFAWGFYRLMKREDEGTDRMREIAAHVRKGCDGLPAPAVQGRKHHLCGAGAVLCLPGLRRGGCRTSGFPLPS